MNNRILMSGLLVAIMSASAFGAGFIGNTTAQTKKGQWITGYNYMYSDMDLDQVKTTATIQTFDEMGVLDPSHSGPATFKLDVEDFKTQRHYFTLSHGITDQWEMYFQFGTADVKAKRTDSDFGEIAEGFEGFKGFNFDNDHAWGWGTRITLSEQDNVKWGFSVQMNWVDTSFISTFADATETEILEINIKTHDLLIAVGPSVDMGGWILYGGPFLYDLSGDLNDKLTITEPGLGTFIFKEKGDLELDRSFGGFVGAQFVLNENAYLTSEISFTGDGMALGSGITWWY